MCEIKKLVNFDLGALSSIAGLSNAGGNISILAGTGIRITPDESTKSILITATSEAAPSLHAVEHSLGGSDVIAPDDIGASSKSIKENLTLSASSWNNNVFGRMSNKTFKNYVTSGNETHAQPVALDGFSDKKSFVNPYHPDNLTLYGTSVDAYNSVLFTAPNDLIPLSARLHFTANLAAIISEHRRQMTFDFEKWLANYEKLFQFDEPDIRVKVARTSPYTITLNINGTTINEWKVSEFVQKWVDTKKFR